MTHTALLPPLALGGITFLLFLFPPLVTFLNIHSIHQATLVSAACPSLPSPGNLDHFYDFVTIDPPKMPISSCCSISHLHVSQANQTQTVQIQTRFPLLTWSSSLLEQTWEWPLTPFSLSPSPTISPPKRLLNEAVSLTIHCHYLNYRT